MSEKAPSDFSAHVPVLYHEVLHYLQPETGGRYVDGTVGAGGHASGILESSAPDGKVLGLDLDPTALQLAAERLQPYGKRAVLVHGSYVQIRQHIHAIGWDNVDGILVDLGVSSMQLDRPEKGFSFQHDGPLDMRFNPEQERSAWHILNQSAQQELAMILKQYGELPGAERMAAAIIQARPLQSTSDLVHAILSVQKANPRKVHPATLVFQAIRIAVNGELDAVKAFLPEAIACLKPGGRLAVITFHSLEDRIVKHYFKLESTDCICPPKQPVCTCGHVASVNLLTRKSVQASTEETSGNTRARSARLRVVEKK